MKAILGFLIRLWVSRKRTFSVCELCNRRLNKQPAIKVHLDHEDDWHCDTCGSIAVEWPHLGWRCMKTGELLIKVGKEGLYHSDTVALWRRLKFAVL